MPYCPECKTEYEAGQTTCADCGADLVNRPPGDEEEAIVALHASTAAEAQVAEATLEAEGIPAYVAAEDAALPGVGSGVTGDGPEYDVVVPADLADEAREVLSTPPPSEEELAEAAGFPPESEDQI